jgi:hypothetical protein
MFYNDFRNFAVSKGVQSERFGPAKAAVFCGSSRQIAQSSSLHHLA